MTEQKFEGEFKKQFNERLCWAIGSLHKYAKVTRVIDEDDFAMIYRILEDAKKECPIEANAEFLNAPQIGYEEWVANEIEKWYKKWFGS